MFAFHRMWMQSIICKGMSERLVKIISIVDIDLYEERHLQWTELNGIKTTLPLA